MYCSSQTPNPQIGGTRNASGSGAEAFGRRSVFPVSSALVRGMLSCLEIREVPLALSIVIVACCSTSPRYLFSFFSCPLSLLLHTCCATT